MKGVEYMVMTLLVTGMVRARSLSREIIDLARRIDERYGIDSTQHDEFFKLLGLYNDFHLLKNEDALTGDGEPNYVDDRVNNIASSSNKDKGDLIFAGLNKKLSKKSKAEQNFDLDDDEDGTGKEKEIYKQSAYRSNFLSRLYNSDGFLVNGKRKALKIVPENLRLSRDRSKNRLGNINRNSQEIDWNNNAFEGNSQKKLPDINIQYIDDYNSRDYNNDSEEEYFIDSNNEGINYREEYEDRINKDYIEGMDEEDALLSSLEYIDNDNEDKIDDDFGLIDYLERTKQRGERDERNRKLYDDLSNEDHAVMDYEPDEDYKLSESEE